MIGFVMGDPDILVYKANETALIWNVDDISLLRTMYRIVGNLSGCNVKRPYQNSSRGLPLQLMPEEVTLLLHEGIIKLVSNDGLQSMRSNDEKEAYHSYLQSTFDAQNSRYKEARQQMVIKMSDHIIEGYMKKKAGMSLSRSQRRKLKRKQSDASNCRFDMTTRIEDGAHENSDGSSSDGKVALIALQDEEKSKVIDALIAKIPDIPQNSCFKHLPTECPWLKDDDRKTASWNFPSTSAEKLRYLVFKDLWKRKLYITRGTSFGGDFLVYPGDPVQFHAMYIAVCVEEDEKLDGKRIIGLGRMGNNVRKTTVLCSVDGSGSVQYMSLNFSSFHWPS